MNFQHLDLNLLRVFDVVMVERNLTRAAERLSVTQPAVSNALRRLQDTIGEDLVTRVATGVAPTPRAEALWPDVRAALGDLRRAFGPETFDPLLDSAAFGIAMADGTAAMLLPSLVRRIGRAAPNVDVRIVPLSTHDPRPLLDRGDADLAIGYFPAAVAAIEAEGSNANFGRQHVLASDYVCVMREGHPLASAPLDIDAYCAARHLVASASGRPSGLVDQALLAVGRRRRVVLTVNQYFTAARVVAGSDLLAVLPSAFLEATGNRERLLVRPLPIELPALTVSMLWHLRADAQPAQQWLRKELTGFDIAPDEGGLS